MLTLLLLISACSDGGSHHATTDPATEEVVEEADTGDDTFVARLNDTGIIDFADGSSNDLAEEPEDYPGQDASFGRDALAVEGTLEKIGGGVAGFDFTKIGADGQALADQEVDYATTPWVAVQDNVTGLMWEVKTDDDGLRDQDWTYTWYNSDAATNGGSVGTENGGTCFDTENCDTEHYVAAVNAVGLAGYNDWRLPSREELHSLVDYSVTSPAIDENYFPSSLSISFWSSSPSAGSAESAWHVYFYDGFYFTFLKSYSYAVRLVRGGQ
jgi:hypothetical protein